MLALPLNRHEKNSPYARGFLVKIKLFFIYIRQRQNIYVARYQYSLGIYCRIYPAAGVRNIPAAPDRPISGSWRLMIAHAAQYKNIRTTHCLRLK